MDELSEQKEEKIKRKRKTKDEVVRAFSCVFPNCNKAYGYLNKFGKFAQSAHQVEASGVVGETEERGEPAPDSLRESSNS